MKIVLGIKPVRYRFWKKVAIYKIFLPTSQSAVVTVFRKQRNFMHNEYVRPSQKYVNNFLLKLIYRIVHTAHYIISVCYTG